MWILIGMGCALVLGVWVGLGTPGVRGRQDRVVAPGSAKRLARKHINWLKPERHHR